MAIVTFCCQNLANLTCEVVLDFVLNTVVPDMLDSEEGLTKEKLLHRFSLKNISLSTIL